jgi:hypothetical protein
VLYPNTHLEQVGSSRAQQDIDECMTLAQQSGVSPKRGGQVGRSAATGAAVGGAAAGAVLGKDVLRSAGAGAAAGAAGAAVRGALKSQETDPVFKNFVASCLSERGYEVKDRFFCCDFFASGKADYAAILE